MCLNLLSDSDPVARKQYVCIWCAERILKGEKHHRQTGILYGDFQSNRYHTECFAAAVLEFSEDRCEFEEGSYRRGTRESA